MQTSSLIKKYNLKVNRCVAGYLWTVRNPENGNVYSGTSSALKEAFRLGIAKIIALEDAPTPTLPNGELI
jgi:hypothetical protein